MRTAKSRAVYVCVFLLILLFFSQITLGAVKESLKNIAEQEWERWDRGARKVSEPQMSSIVANYFAAGGCPGSDPTTVPWSGGFISYVAKNAGITDFPASCLHTNYFKSIKNNPGICRTYPMSEWNKVDVGDIVCYCTVTGEESKQGKTECSIDYNNPSGRSHCDIVVNNLGNGQKEVIGGNVYNTVAKRVHDVSKDISADRRWYGFISCEGEIPKASSVSSSIGPAQVQVGTIGVSPAGIYEGCSGKKIGLVGASNTWDTNPDGSSIPLAWRNVKIIQDMCPGAAVYLNAKGGANPETQASLLTKILYDHDDLDYVIIDPSANGQFEFSGWSAEHYKNAVINLAQLVKSKNQNIKVIILTNTPLKGALGKDNAGNTIVIGTDAVVQRVNAFNADLLNNRLGVPNLIDYAANTYSATEDPSGSDSCGKYCGGDKLHFGESGRKKVMKAVMDTVFGAPATAVVTNNAAVSPASSTSSVTAENCLNSQRCQEMDEVWLKIVQWVNNLRKGQIFDAAKGWRSYQEKLPSIDITPTITPAAPRPGSAVTNFCAATYGTNEQKALLDTIAWAEGTREKYNVLFGGKQFTSYTSHPVETGEMPKEGITAGGYTSTAAGRYQFIYSTFTDLRKNNYFAAGFNYQEQDRAALDGLIVKKRGLSEQELKSAVDAGSFELVWDKLAAEWASLPYTPKGGQSYYGQPVKKNSDLINVYQTCLQFHKTGGIPSAGSSASPSSPVISTVVSAASDFVSDVVGIFGGNCPPEMANIGNKYCIDKWEATVVDKNTKAEASPHYIPILTGPITADWQYNQFVNKETKPAGYPMPPRGAEAEPHFVAMAVSAPEKIPASYVTREAAEQACQNAGKRLCTQQEWYKACAGPDGPSSLGQKAYPYGQDYQAGKCNVAIASPWPPSVIGRTNQGNDMMDPRISTVKGANGQLMKQPAGSFSECTNEYGVFDMVGNVHEIVDDLTTNGKATFLGAHFARPGKDQTPESQGCQEATKAHDPVAYTDYSIGFRCCASLS